MTSAFHDPERLSRLEGGLAEGWTEAVLDDLVVHALGGEWGVTCEGDVPAGRVKVSVVRGTEFREWEDEKGATAAERAVKGSSLEKRQLRAGDLIVEISGGGPDQPVGRVLLVDEEAVRRAENPLICSNFCRQIRLHPEVDPAFIALALRHRYERGDFDAWQSQTTNIRNLDFQEFLRGVTLPLPPLGEQRRIVARAEELLSQIRQTRRRLARLPRILKRFRQSVLADAYSGRLTEDWRARRSDRELPRFSDATDWEIPEPLEVPDIPETWTLVALNDLVSQFQYGTSLRAEGDARTGIPVLRMSNIQDGRTDLSVLKYVDRAAPGIDAFRLKSGDILFNRTNSPGLVGKAAVFSHEIEAVFASYLVRLKTHKDRVLSSFVCAWINSPWGRQWARTVRTDCVSQSNINSSKLRKMPVPTPPLTEQKEIVRRIEKLLKFADAVEARVAAGAACAERLSHSVLDKALRGELVPTEAELAREEGRASWEPAWVLLGRIKSAPRRKVRASRRGRQLSFPGQEAPRKSAGTSRSRPVPLYDPHQVLVAFRQACWGAGEMSEDELIRKVADRLGVARLGKNIRARLKDHLETAIQRRIVARKGEMLEGATPTFARYDDDFLLHLLRTSVLRSGNQHEVPTVVKTVAGHLGYGQVTGAVRKRMEDVFRSGVRRGLLGFNGEKVWRR
ncbi:MAG TPA: restriction endonuclease subunit S [Thermoanaerobaculia bacterium]|nr:restriction endonuclease subunit S [Thermoanaerobaculia bacterium]